MDEDIKKPETKEENKEEQNKTTGSEASDSNENTSTQPSISLKPKVQVKPVVDSSQVIKSEKKEEGSLLKQLNNWILPIVSLVVLVIVSITVLMPSAGDTMDTLDEIRNLEQQLDRYESKLSQLEAISITEVNASLQVASQVIKDDLEVAGLAKDVEALARTNNLETKSVSFASTTSSLLNIPGYVKTISGPFSYSGTFNDISDFIADLRTKSPTIVALREISINRSGVAGTEEDALWVANFMIDAFTTSKVQSTNIQDSVSSVINQDLMDEIMERSEYGESLD